MELYSNNEYYKLYKWNMLDLSEVIKPCSIDAVLTDPPYELNFMWKWWDNSWIAFQKETWEKCLKALKPWWYLLAFGGSRTYHRIACAIEDAGFEIRDCIMWLYGSWFPKSMDIGKSIDKKNWVQPIWRKEPTGWITGGKNTGAEEKWWHSINNWYEYPDCTNERAWWGTALKPSYEPIIVARKPLEWSCTDNVIKYWVGGINIDECRIWFDSEEDIKNYENNNDANLRTTKSEWENLWAYEWWWKVQKEKREVPQWRFPANTILTYWDDDKEEVCSGFPDTKSWSKLVRNRDINRTEDTTNWSAFNQFKCGHREDWISNYGDSGNASRYFKNCNFSLRDIDQWKQLYVSNAEKSLEILSETIESIVPISADMLLWMLKDLNVKYAENQLDLWEIHIVPDIVEMLTYDFRKEGLQAILDFIGNYKNCIQLQSLVQFVEKCDSIDTTQTTQNLLKLFGYVRAAITKYTQTIKNEEQKRYIYTPKASKRDRDEWLGTFADSNSMCDRDPSLQSANVPQNRSWKLRKNTHPTVKPCDLMQYLVRLVTPNGWTVLDPFNWSGSTWKAVMYENKDRNKNYKYIWIELTEEYLPIAKARIEYVINKGIEKEKSEPKQEEQTKQRKESALF